MSIFKNLMAVCVPALLASTVSLYYSGTAWAIVLLDEQFDYSDGNLLGNGSWVAINGAGENPVQVQSGQVFLTQENLTGGEEDVETPVSQTLGAGGTFYYGFDLVVDQLPDEGNINQSYFAFFTDVGSVDFVTRVFVRRPASGIEGDMTFGLRTDEDSGPVSFDTVAFNLGQQYRIVGAYEFDSGLSTLWVDPTSPASPSISEVNMSIDEEKDNSMKPIDGFGLRQGGESGDTTQTIDNIIVATTFAEVIGDTPPPTNNADFNGDGVVNIADYTVWRDNLGGPGPDGDANGVDGVDATDYAIWKDQFGSNAPMLSGLSTTPASVPEPATWVLICLLGSILILCHDRRWG